MANRSRIETSAHAVALRTALQANLDFHGADSSYGAHAWHPFPAKFPPQLPRFFIEELSSPDDTVLDPMLGSGTTLVEAVRLGRRAVGCDIDPLARMISAAKLTPIDPAAVLCAGRKILAVAKCDYLNDVDQLQQMLGFRFDADTLEFLNYWFLPQHQLELLSILRNIESLPESEIRSFLEVVFSSAIIAKSGGVSLARDLAHTRPHRDNSKVPPSAFLEFGKRLERNVAALERTRPSSQNGVGAMVVGSQRCETKILAASASDTGLPSDSIDLIVTSPPYANNAIDYMRAHKFSLVWFGWKITDLRKIRSQYLGHDALSDIVYDDLPDQCERTLKRLAERDARKSSSLRRYFGEMATVLGEMRRVLKPNGAAIVVVGTSNLRGVDVETHRGLASIGESIGFHLVGIGTRNLDRDRRMMPARWGHQSDSQIEARMHREYVIGMMK